jgi:phosphatidylserine/phosphatidylglycerophosphate/cardiolipin synthase-like enzyme
MRVAARADGLSAHAIVGTHVVLFGMDVPDDRVHGLLGFAIRRREHQGLKRTRYLPNFLVFKVNDEGDETNHSSLRNPFQEFLWGDYTCFPDRDYTYTVSAMYGVPGDVKKKASVDLDVRTESEDDGTHAIFFNRGVVASQAYANRFDNKPPHEIGAEAYEWLSRGLFEAMDEFIGQAKNSRYAVRAAVYEFTHRDTLDTFGRASDRGADVEIIFDCSDVAAPPGKSNLTAIRSEELDALCARRTQAKIAHNKFIVLLYDGKPKEVWTGSTNFTEGGIYGHSNLGHIVRSPRVAARYLAYWKQLRGDPKAAVLRQWTEQETVLPQGRPRRRSITSVFSPRRGFGALNWYARLMDGAETSVFLTGAFGVSKELTEIFNKEKPYLRYLLLDKRQGNVLAIARNPSNRVTAGAYLGEGGWRQWLEEVTTRKLGLNNHVQYIHTKFMLIDPLDKDPIVVSGSANFSRPSTNVNDENMLVIRGNTRVADIYLGEFMRLFTHFRFRGKTETPDDEPAPGPDGPTATSSRSGKKYLWNDDGWARRFYVKDSPREKERQLFRAPLA